MNIHDVLAAIAELPKDIYPFSLVDYKVDGVMLRSRIRTPSPVPGGRPLCPLEALAHRMSGRIPTNHVDAAESIGFEETPEECERAHLADSADRLDGKYRKELEWVTGI